MTEDDTVTGDARWRDELVELHVLAQHGDTTAAARARQWCAQDPIARQTWEEVERACSHLNDQS
jgi:hypothetical protein